MTGFFNPQGFLTAMKQVSYNNLNQSSINLLDLYQGVTRAHKGWALDSVVLHNDVTKFISRDDVISAPDEGVYVYGLYLEGAAWHKSAQRLTESKPKVLFEVMPVIHIGAVQGGKSCDLKSSSFHLSLFQDLNKMQDLFIVVQFIKNLFELI